MQLISMHLSNSLLMNKSLKSSIFNLDVIFSILKIYLYFQPSVIKYHDKGFPSTTYYNEKIRKIAISLYYIIKLESY